MNVEQIEKFLKQKHAPEQQVKIDFKARTTMYGLFVEGKDYTDLKVKNFWRIISVTNLEAYNKSKDTSLAKIFSGAAFSRLAFKDKVI